MNSFTQRILIVEDDPQIRNFISYVLSAEGFASDNAATAQSAMALLTANIYDLMLLDLGLPDYDGMDVIRKVREWSEIPIIVVSARDQDQEKAQALDSGADDYLTKPFSLSVLRSRIQAHLRREQRRSWIRQDGWQIDRQQDVAFRGQPLALTRSEKEILIALRRQPGRIWTKDQLLALINGSDRDSGPAAITEHIKNIRSKCRKLNEDPIETVWGIGYRWKKEDAEKPGL